MMCPGIVVRPRFDDDGGFLEWVEEESDIDVPQNEQGCVACCAKPQLTYENGEALPTISCEGENCVPKSRPKAGSTTGEIEIWCCRT